MVVRRSVARSDSFKGLRTSSRVVGVAVSLPNKFQQVNAIGLLDGRTRRKTLTSAAPRTHNPSDCVGFCWSIEHRWSRTNWRRTHDQPGRASLAVVIGTAVHYQPQ